MPPSPAAGVLFQAGKKLRLIDPNIRKDPPPLSSPTPPPLITIQYMDMGPILRLLQILLLSILFSSLNKTLILIHFVLATHTKKQYKTLLYALSP